MQKELVDFPAVVLHTSQAAIPEPFVLLDTGEESWDLGDQYGPIGPALSSDSIFFIFRFLSRFQVHSTTLLEYFPPAARKSFFISRSNDAGTPNAWQIVSRMVTRSLSLKACI
mmetsp:Transcript_70835/g.189128  ORF Transcript_70835/g.189128 Transcript_70835/m.189128 type:complete len:113 (-) Transcript_70835:600-938(-)